MSDPATQAVIAFCIVLGIWFVIGWQMNRRHGRRLLEWIIRGLRASGGQITASRLGLSGFQVNVHDAQAPFKSIETTVLLEPREVLLLWMLNYLRGGADYFVLNGTLRASPRSEVEVTTKGRRFAKPLLKELNEKTWTRQETDSGLIIASRGKQGQKLAEAISPLVEDLRPRLLRLSLSKKAPHLLVNLSLADLDEESALLLLSSVRDLAQTVSAGGR
jgi:hypothetical protein